MKKTLPLGSVRLEQPVSPPYLMAYRSCRIAALLIAIAMVTLASAPADAQLEIVFNTDTGEFLLDDVATNDFFGIGVESFVVPQGDDGSIRQFRFSGDLDFISSDNVSAVGNLPLSIYAGGDVNIPSGTEFNFNASGFFGSLGGGNGGASKWR